MINWITNEIGTCSYINKNKPDVKIIDVRELVDKAGNPPELVKTKIDEALNYLHKGKKIIICCDYGISRSNAVAAGILAKHEKISLEKAVQKIMRKTRQKAIKIEVLSTVNKIISEGKKNAKTKKRTILVTGGTGFIGKALITLLKKKYNMVVPLHNQIDLLEDVVKLDLLVKKQNIDTIIHLANPRIYTTNESMGKTLVMLKNILDICIENRLFLVFPSSWEIYSGYTNKQKIVNETVVPKPKGTYGQTKFLCESLIETYHKRYKLTYTILRSSPIYGLGSNKPKFIWTFLEKAKRNKNIVTHKYKNGYPILDLLYIDDFITALESAIKRKIQGVINVGSGVGTDTNEIAKMIVKKTNSSSKISHIKINDYWSNIIMDIRYASKILKWKPRFDIEKGLDLIVSAGK